MPIYLSPIHSALSGSAADESHRNNPDLKHLLTSSVKRKSCQVHYSLFARYIVIAFLLMLIEGTTYAAVTIDGGQIMTVPGSEASPFDAGGNLTVGVTTNGELHISNGGRVSSDYGFIGYNAGATGIATVDGLGSKWNNSGVLNVGHLGSGTLIITNGGIVSDEDPGTPDIPVINAIGNLVGSTGNVTITGSGSQWINASNINVGSEGSGTLLVENGGIAIAGNDGIIGYRASSTGAVTITGPGSQWNIMAGIATGFQGNGTLNIVDGGLVSVMKNSYIGLYPTGVGVVTVSGTGSQWHNANNLTVGGDGDGTLLIENSGLVSARQIFGQGTLSLDNGTLQARASNANFISFTGAGVFELLAGGGTIDSNGFDIGANSVISGIGSLTKTGMGTLTLDSVNTYTGDTLINQGTLAVTATGNIAASHVFVATTGTLAGEGIVGSTVNAGIVAPGMSSVGSLTVAGNYTGNTGQLHIETQLGDDNSPTDRLAIMGNADGNTAVKVTNLGGLGAQTVNGINIIGVGGLAADDTFSLAGDYITADGQQAVIGGAYAYTLHASGNAATAGRAWYLFSTLDNPLEPQEPDGGSGPRYQAGVPLYEQYPQILAALNTLPTLQQRVGNHYWSQKAVSEQVSNNLDDTPWAWGRIDGQHQVTSPASSTSSSARDINVWKLQTGIDVPLHQSQDGSLLIGGVNFTYGKADADINSYFGYGSIDTSAYGLGASLTWYGNDGVYVDGQVQTLWFDSDVNSGTEGHAVANGNRGRGYATSLETGKRYSLGNGLSLTPQIQLIYSRVNFDPFSDPYGSQVSLEEGDSLRARAGVSLDKETAWVAKDGTTSRAHFYTNLDLYNEFLNGTKTRVSGVDFTARDERQSVGIGAGVTQEWQNGRYALYGNVNLLTAPHNMGNNYALGGTVGLRVSW